MKKSFVVLLGIVLFILSGCGNNDLAQLQGKNAEEVVTMYYDGIKKGDYQQAYELLSPEAQEQLTNQVFQKQYSNASYSLEKVLGSMSEGDKAVIYTLIKLRYPQAAGAVFVIQALPLLKQEGVWRMAGQDVQSLSGTLKNEFAPITADLTNQLKQDLNAQKILSSAIASNQQFVTENKGLAIEMIKESAGIGTELGKDILVEGASLGKEVLIGTVDTIKDAVKSIK